MMRHLWLVHPEESMSGAFERRFAGLPGVRVIRGTFEDLEPHDAFVTAGNSSLAVVPSREARLGD